MGNRRRSRGEWAKLVEEWQGSGLSSRAFAERKGISQSTLAWWASRLRRERAASPALVPVQVLGASDRQEGEFRLELRDGRTLSVPPVFDAGSLRKLLDVLGESAC